MNTKFFAGVAAAAALAISPAAFAQDLDAEAAAGDDAAAAEASGEADAAASSASAVSFTDAQIASFAQAVTAVQSIQADTSLDATTKQTRMQSAIEAAGLDIQTFNAIATQSQADADLQAKVQAHLNPQP